MKIVYRTHLFVLLFCLCSSSMFAQRLITGTITDATTGEALIGATVVSKEDKTKGTITNFEGAFTINVPENTTALILSYTGYTTKEENVVGVSSIIATLTSGQALQDVVVIGYGTVKRSDATGLVQTVSSDKFNKGAITGPQDLLSGKIAGVVVTPGNGAPGEGADIRIRGQSSLSASSNPLIVIDGFPLEGTGVNGNRNPLNFINPNDIETFTVLKDASAAAIYGNRASGGVILITTKKGATGKTKIGYSANFSVGNVTKLVDVLDATEYRRAIDSLPPDARVKALPLMGDANTNWQKEIYRPAHGTDHNLYVSGGVGKFPYRMSFGYTDKEGVLLNDHFDRFTTGLNVNPSFFNNTLQVNVSYKRMVSHNRFADRGAIGTAIYMDPTQQVYDAASIWGGYKIWEKDGVPQALTPANPVAMLEQKDDRSLVNQRNLSGEIDYRLPFFKALRLHLTLGLDRSNGVGRVLAPTNAAFTYDKESGGGTKNEYHAVRLNKVLENYLNYKETFGRHSFDFMLGHSWQQFRDQDYTLNASASGKDGNGGTPIAQNGGSENFLISQFTRLNYGFNDRILLTGTVRRDGTSRFGPANRWGIFPAGALAVKVVDQPNAQLSLLKARVGVGVTGQQEVSSGRYPHLAVYQGSIAGASYQFGNTFYETLRANGYNGDLQWEETTTFNVGLDFGVVRNKVTGAIDVYQRDTRDLIVYAGLAALSNLSNFGDINVGTMQTKGAELSLNFNLLESKNFGWEIATNGSYNTYKVTKLNENPDPSYAGIPTGSIAGGVGSNIQRHAVGYAPSTFYVYKQLYDANGNLLEGKFADLNGDGSANDFYYAGNPAPKYTFGLTNNFRAGPVTLSFAGRANFGNYIFDNVRSDIGYLDRVYNSNDFLANVHQSALDLNVRKQASLTYSDHFLKNASFFRMDHITLNYAVPARFAKSLRLTATVQNPFVVTNYDGLDPEIFNGIDNNFYPRPRTYVFGVAADF